MALDWTTALPMHWVDEIEQQRPNYEPDEQIPEWMAIDLPEPGASASYGTKAIVEHILDHRSSYDYGEFDRQLGVILSNEAEWINDSRRSALDLDVDGEEVDLSYDKIRSDFVDLVTMIEDRGFHVPTRGFEAMESLNADGYMTKEYGDFGRKFASSVVKDISRERVISGSVPMPDDLGIDFTRSTDITPELARSVTQSYDLDRMNERAATLRASLRRELDGITGPVDEDSEIARSIDGARVDFGQGSSSDAEREFDEIEGARPLTTPESIEELLSELDARDAQRRDDRGADEDRNTPSI